ncbi:MAG: hypothetical protein SFU57_09200 [Gemmatimonadales bacterium]|nr:hypothetical protein [Gemmatimonadales bacterium]
MKDTHLTLRISAALSAELEARATADAVPKSRLVREAVARYLEPGPSSTPLRLGIPAAELLAHWDTLPHLTPEDAESFRRDIAGARDLLAPPDAPWE